MRRLLVLFWHEPNEHRAYGLVVWGRGFRLSVGHTDYVLRVDNVAA